MEVTTNTIDTQSAGTIQVHFKLQDGGQLVETRMCSAEMSVLEMKEHFARKWEVTSQGMAVSYQGEMLSNATTLNELGVTSDTPVTLVVQPPPVQPPPVQPPPVQPPPVQPPDQPVSTHKGTSIITTQIEGDDGTEREVLIKIERSGYSKPFLGGYKHRVSGVEYHHASAQTLPKQRPNKGVDRFDRDSQTVVTKNKRLQLHVDAATQMNKTGCFVNTSTDKVIVSGGEYETAEQYQQRVLDKVILLQSYWRRWLAKLYVSGLRQERMRMKAWKEAELVRRQKERDEHAKREFERRMNPRTKEDFDLLYHALEMWRQEELAYINDTTTGAERKGALCSLLEQEAQLIASIGRHRVVADEKSKEAYVQRLLDKAAAPRQWMAFDGGITEMDTPFTQRAQQLRDIYSTVASENLSRDERLDALLTLKSTVKEHDCKLTRDIVELVDREADLLVRGMKTSSLQGLRKRISSLFFQYCKTPLFNPEAAKHIKVPQDPTSLSTNIYYCRSCSQYLPSTEFELSANSRYVGHCRMCRNLDNQARAREDWSKYRVMLKQLRQSEERRQDGSQIIFLTQEGDLRYLVENIWGGQSALSGCKDLFELMLVRWEGSMPWSPWNCILLTQEEADSHAQLGNVMETYGSHFIHKVQHRHILARNYFSHLPEMAKEMKVKVHDLPPLSPSKEMKHQDLAVEAT